MAFLKNAAKYLIPFVLYLAVTPVLGLFLDEPMYAGYVIKTILVTAVLLYYWKQYNIRFRLDFLAIGIGIAIFLLWVGIEGFYPHIGEPSAFNPYLFEGFTAVLLIIIRVFGAIVTASIVEELFVRSFLIRYLVKEDFENVRQGTFTWLSFIITVLFFGFSHQRWLAGIITGVLLTLLLYKRKNIGSCIIAHSVANACLAAFVLTTENWFFW